MCIWDDGLFFAHQLAVHSHTHVLHSAIVYPFFSSFDVFDLFLSWCHRYPFLSLLLLFQLPEQHRIMLGNIGKKKKMIAYHTGCQTVQLSFFVFLSFQVFCFAEICGPDCSYMIFFLGCNFAGFCQDKQDQIWDQIALLTQDFAEVFWNIWSPNLRRKESGYLCPCFWHTHEAAISLLLKFSAKKKDQNIHFLYRQNCLISYIFLITHTFNCI